MTRLPFTSNANWNLFFDESVELYWAIDSSVVPLPPDIVAVLESVKRAFEKYFGVSM
jgi:hypothetical protein